jgi:hypothetical protein
MARDGWWLFFKIHNELPPGRSPSGIFLTRIRSSSVLISGAAANAALRLKSIL